MRFNSCKECCIRGLEAEQDNCKDADVPEQFNRRHEPRRLNTLGAGQIVNQCCAQAKGERKEEHERRDYKNPQSSAASVKIFASALRMARTVIVPDARPKPKAKPGFESAFAWAIGVLCSATSWP